MTQTGSGCGKSNRLAARRLTLLASVGALGALLLAGPAGYWHSEFGTDAASASEFDDATSGWLCRHCRQGETGSDFGADQSIRGTSAVAGQP